MSVGPFDETVTIGESEYGGKGGLVQSQADGHQPTVSEVAGIRNRAAMLSEDGVDPVTGISVEGLEPQ